MSDDEYEAWECDGCGFKGQFRDPWSVSVADHRTDTYCIPCPFCDGKLREIGAAAAE